jgi:DNA-binding GntR family transcriptional regulator
VLGRGVRVSTIDENDIAEVYCLRILIEPLIVRLTALNISRGELDHLLTIVDQAEKLTSLDDMPARRQLNMEFHSMICTTCGSGTLKRLHKIVWGRFPDWLFYEGLHRQPDTLKSRLQREIKEHRALLNAISNGDVDRAEQISISHIVGMKGDLLEVFEIPSHIIEEKQQQMGLLRMPTEV